MSLSCPYPCPYTYLSAHLSTTHLQSYDMTICFLWASASFDADHRGKSSLVHGTSVPRQKLTMEYGPIVLLYPLPSNGWYLMGYHVLVVLQSGLLLGWEEAGHI